ncbi:MAG: relaxase/mobilization nuclease domain-containing protein [Gallionella sp.]|nr:relaxase/mobilization nuclease domain-containing protein [Gallionella sp.]MDD4947789.1 relaxase/mobilization nuclease domain-containing protein [Gallionella sp.]
MKGMQKISRGRGFRGALNYAFERDRNDVEPGRHLGGNMDGATPSELASEFAITRQVRPDIKKPVWHNSLRLPTGEILNDEQWVKVADDYMRRMGFTDLHQRAYIQHDDAKGQHIHIIASRIGLDGRLYLGKNENLISTKIIQQLERDHGLTVTKGVELDREGNAVSPDRTRLKKGEQELADRLDRMPPKERLQKIIDRIFDEHFPKAEDKPDVGRDLEQSQIYRERAAALGLRLGTRAVIPPSFPVLDRPVRPLCHDSEIPFDHGSNRDNLFPPSDEILHLDALEAQSDYALWRNTDSKPGELTATQFAEALSAYGIKYRAHIASTGRMNGFSFECDGVSFSGSQLGKAYGWNGLVKRGLLYDSERDRDNLVLHVVQTKEPQAQPKKLIDAYRSYLAEQRPLISSQRASVASERKAMVQCHQEARTALAELQRQQRKVLFEKYRQDPAGLKIQKMLLAKHQADKKAALQENLTSARKSLISPKLPDYTEWLATLEATVQQQQAVDAAKQLKVKRKKKSELDAIKDEAQLSGQSSTVFPLKPAPADIRNFSAIVDLARGAIEYRSASGTLSFTDVGEKINIAQQNDPDTVLAALQLGVQKYGKLTITGDVNFRQLCVELAAKHGFMFADDNLNQSVETERSRCMTADAQSADLVRGSYTGAVHSIEADAVFIEVRRGYLRKLPMDEAFKKMLIGEKFQIRYKNGKPDVKICSQKYKKLLQTR